MRIQSYGKFWQRIHKSAREKEFPLRAMFELTYRCNFRCRHCYVPYSYRKKSELKTKDVFSILDQLADIGCFYLGFTGGEPFLRKDIIPILWYAKKKGFEIIIYTNGSLIDNEIAKELQRIRPNKVDITIPAVSKDAFDRISGLKGARDKVFRAIEILHKKGINLGFKTCLTKGMEHEIKDIQNFASSLGAFHRLDDTLSPCLDGSKKPYRYRSQMSKDRCQLNIRRWSEDKNCESETLIRHSSATSLFKCGVGRSQAAITPLGELKMCVMIDYPKYKILDCKATSRKLRAQDQKIGLRGAWGRLKSLVASIKPDENYQCDKCKLEPYCKWCPATSWLYNRSFTSCQPREA